MRKATKSKLISLVCLTGSKVDYWPIKKSPWVKKLGATIQINRKSYAIHYCHKVFQNEVEVCGICLPSHEVILINAALGDVESTLLHEVGHGEMAEAGFRQRPDWTRELEEMVVETMAESVSHNFKLTAK